MEYIAFLRGVNVGGHIAKMDRVRALFSEMGLDAVRTYIQSGNVFFESPLKDRKALKGMIEKSMEEAFGFEVPVCLRTPDELEKALRFDPFKGQRVTPDMRLCINFAADPLPRKLELPLFSPKRDIQILKTSDRDAYVIWYIINGRPPSAQGFLDKTLGQPTTSRFFHTAAKILEAAREK